MSCAKNTVVLVMLSHLTPTHTQKLSFPCQYGAIYCDFPIFKYFSCAEVTAMTLLNKA